MLFAGCSQAPPTPVSPTPVSPTSTNAKSEPKPPTDWTVSAPQVNLMDNVSTQFVSTGYTVRLVLCFDNGKPCGHGTAPIFVRSPCWIDNDEPGSYHRSIRIKFDDDKPMTERWGITDDHKGLIPPKPLAFVAELKRHKTLMLEFGCDRSDTGDVITLGVRGLQEALDSANLKLTSVASPPPADVDQAVKVASETYRLDPDLLSSVLNVGTEYNVRPISPKRAAQHLREDLERYDFDVVKALAAYKVESERVDQYSGVPSEYDTKAFVASVVRDFNKKKLMREKQ